MDINLDTSDWRLCVMCVIVLGCLAFWLGAVFRAAANPGVRNPRTAIKGPVQGGRPAEQGPAQEPVQRGPVYSVPRPARDRDTSVPMPAQRADSPAGNVQPTSRPQALAEPPRNGGGGGLCGMAFAKRLSRSSEPVAGRPFAASRRTTGRPRRPLACFPLASLITLAL
jgi:hypothetical protein